MPNHLPYPNRRHPMNPLLPTDDVFHGTDMMFGTFDLSSSLGAHFGSRQAAIDRLKSTGRGQIEIDPEEDSQGIWWAAEQVYANAKPILHGPFPSAQDAKTFCAFFDKDRKPAQFNLTIENPLELPDLGTWGFWNVVRQLRLSHPELHLGSMDDLQEALYISDQAGWSALQSILTKAGYDAIAYTNEVEGKGSRSWIVWDHTKIHSQMACARETPSCEAPAP